ncbi:hypothetical protein HG536_0G01220 [Torulaspora globosa]|uniref:DNA primase large subunit n=1 Tax=Torulaspora globosa TaxID=48254 RepID=A0A7G3ZL77_9SACH|nr:uncharacterized protein HG536_0G01220 [Torulaspora globosa]QLL34263.1 hypothetical protein HG536_0G01220 [Torulaspora globosa]
MFRQSKKRASSRKNFSVSESGDGVSGHLILGSTSASEKKLYDSIYASKLSFYDLPPQGEITLDQFEVWAIDRLKILLEIESCVSRNKNMKEIETIIKPHLQKSMPFNTDNLEAKKKDYYSHFILRLCFCRSQDLREKFVRAETMLFRLRFNMLTSQDQIKFVQSLNLPSLQFISEEEKEKLKVQLYQTISPQLQFQLNLHDESQREAYFKQEKFIKLPFEDVIELVGNRQVFLRGGYAYLPQFQQLNLLASEFSSKLTQDLIITQRNLPQLNEDDRLLPILQHLSSGYTISDFQPDEYSKEAGDITAKSVYSADISQHYPLCVQNLFRGLKENHHLRYNGRQQLSLFLKGIGLSADEAMKFWTDAFTNGGHITVDKFNKDYRYNFRHNYGLEGTRIKYKPWDCRIILSKPRPARGEYHGCPYRDWSVEKLSMDLSHMNLTKTQISAVLDSCQKTEYTIACTQVFEYTHGSASSRPSDDQTHIAHPNLYFERSRLLQNQQPRPAAQESSS